MGSNLDPTQEKCYDPRDRTLRFVEREDELDFLCEDFKSLRALMSCGHAVTPTSLTNWCRRLLGQGESRFVCGQVGCGAEWSYTEVCEMALLTPEEKTYFEKALAANMLKDDYDTKSCPGCSVSLVRRKGADLRVSCTACTANKKRTYEFCWQCLREWKGPAARSDRCDNNGCCNPSLEVLRSCEEIFLLRVAGAPRCPSVRACPVCGALLEHMEQRCKTLICSRCKEKFCFVCLKLSEDCLKTSKPYGQCSSGVAPRQTSIPVWHKR